MLTSWRIDDGRPMTRLALFHNDLAGALFSYRQLSLGDRTCLHALCDEWMTSHRNYQAVAITLNDFWITAGALMRIMDILDPELGDPPYTRLRVNVSMWKRVACQPHLRWLHQVRASAVDIWVRGCELGKVAHTLKNHLILSGEKPILPVPYYSLSTARFGAVLHSGFSKI